MREFVAYIVKNLVDDRESVTITETDGGQGMVIALGVEKSDIGKVIGKRGRTIRAIRTLLTSVASRHGIRVHLEILDGGRPVATQETDEFGSAEEEPNAVSGARDTDSLEDDLGAIPLKSQGA